MSAIPLPIQKDRIQPADNSVNETFLRFLPAVESHARAQFRGLKSADREEAIAETKAAAFLNLHQASRNGKSHRITSSTLAHYAVLSVKDGRRVGGGTDSKTDAMSFKAQRLGGFKVLGLPWDDAIIDCLRASHDEVWRLNLRHDRRTLPSDQAAFRIDWSLFLARQHERTRKALALLAAGYQQTEVADELGVTPSAVCQRRKRAAREWKRLLGDADPTTDAEERQSPSPV